MYSLLAIQQNLNGRSTNDSRFLYVKKEDINKDKIENAKSERRIRIVKDDRKISQRITVEETRIKSKKADFIEHIKNKSVINSQTADSMEKSIKIKTYKS